MRSPREAEPPASHSGETQGHQEPPSEPQHEIEAFLAIQRLPFAEDIQADEGRGDHLADQEQGLHDRLRRQPIRPIGAAHRHQGHQAEPPEAWQDPPREREGRLRGIRDAQDQEERRHDNPPIPIDQEGPERRALDPEVAYEKEPQA